ncbi:MAG TPA: asparagine synthase (glutamine-hydrolyzing) [Polyangia bacterium]
MCGIAGHVGLGAGTPRGSEDARALVRAMTDAIAHRGPDASAVHQNGPAVLGHTRLAIIDLSTEANQPMVSADGQVTLVFNGEIYNFHELAAGLRAAGVALRTKSDTEVLLELYRLHGPSFVGKMRGMFAFAIWDAPRRRLLLGRDRLGKKPLYFYLGARGLSFASEMRALLADGDIARQPEPRALHAYLSLGFVPTRYAAIEGVRKVPPGTIAVYENGSLRVEKYWELKFAPRPRPVGELIEELRSLMFEAVKLRLVSDVPLGAFLSGGIDSSAVVAIMSKVGAKPVKTFSIGFEEKDFSEVEYARKVAKLYETEHHEEILRPRAAELLPKLVRFYGEPFADPSALPSYLLSEMTRKHVTVALSGDGGDEAFAGYTRYAHEKLARFLRLLPRALVMPAARFIEKTFPGRRAGFWGEVGATVRTHARLIQLDETTHYLAQFGNFGPAQLDELCTPDFAAAGADAGRALYAETLDSGSATDALARLLELDTKVYLVDDIFTKVDIASMANSLEVRCPLVDHRLIEFAASVPSEMKMKGFRGKWLLRKALGDLLPHDILYRRKRGFGIPHARWLRGELRPMLRDTLSSPRVYARGFLQRAAVERLMDEHDSGRVDHGLRLWNLLWLELWFQTFVDAR